MLRGGLTGGPLEALASPPTTSLHHTTLGHACVRFTCPGRDAEGQEHGLVVSHADVGPDVVVGDNLLLALRLGKANRGRDVGGGSGGLPGEQRRRPLCLWDPPPPCPLLRGAAAGSEPPVSSWPPGGSGCPQGGSSWRRPGSTQPLLAGWEGSGLERVATFLGGWRQRSLGAGLASAHGHHGR